MSRRELLIQRSTAKGQLSVRAGTARVLLDRTVKGQIKIRNAPRTPVVREPQNVTVNLIRGGREVVLVRKIDANITPIIVRGGPGIQGEQGPAGPPGSGSVSLFPTDNVVSGFRLIVNGGDGPEHADILEVTHGDQILGIALNSAVNPGETVGVQVSGPITDPSFNFTPGLPVLVGLDGILTQDTQEIPGRAWQTIVGHATDSNTVFVNLQDPTFLC